MPGSTDCELIRDGLLAQPANAWSSCAYVLAGALVGVEGFRRGRGRRAWPITFAGALVLLGVGSGYYHGPSGAGAELVHDVPIVWLLLVAGAHSAQALGLLTPRQAWSWLGVLVVGTGIAEVAWPAATIPMTAIAAAVALGGEVAVVRRLPARLSRHRLRGDLVALGLIGAGGLVKLLSGTGGPLCDPNSLIQGHALWHFLTAAGFAVYGILAFDREAD